MLVIGAHSADFVWRAGGAIAVTTANGGAARVIALSYGERGESEELWKQADQTIERVKEIRHGEAQRAAAALGAEFECLDLGDYPLEINASTGVVQLHADDVRGYHAGDRREAGGDGRDEGADVPHQLLRRARGPSRQPLAPVLGEGRDQAGRGVPARDATGGERVVSHSCDQLAGLGSATVYEAGGRRGYVDADLVQILPGSRAAGAARTVRCGQDDNLMVHAVMAEVEPGEVIVLSMPEPRPVALVGELLATQAKARGAAAMLIDASVRDVEELTELGLPIWARWVRVRGADKESLGTIGEPVQVGGATIRQGDLVVLDADGAAVVARERVDEVLAASRERAERELVKRAKLQAGALSFELDGLRQRLEEARTR
jgi:4-hydroxy-4-methyl-2-oxoglutarate aldolase